MIDFTPESIIYIDCADFHDNNAPAGEIKIFYEDSLSIKNGISTHAMSLGLVVALFKHKLPNAQNIFAGIKAQNLEYRYDEDYEKNISQPVMTAGKLLIDFINDQIM